MTLQYRVRAADGSEAEIVLTVQGAVRRSCGRPENGTPDPADSPAK
ncbi:hypothetical protein [Streptomyces sp. NPDC001083]